MGRGRRRRKGEEGEGKEHRERKIRGRRKRENSVPEGTKGNTNGRMFSLGSVPSRLEVVDGKRGKSIYVRVYLSIHVYECMCVCICVYVCICACANCADIQKAERVRR